MIGFFVFWVFFFVFVLTKPLKNNLFLFCNNLRFTEKLLRYSILYTSYPVSSNVNILHGTCQNEETNIDALLLTELQVLLGYL